MGIGEPMGTPHLLPWLLPLLGQEQEPSHCIAGIERVHLNDDIIVMSILPGGIEKTTCVMFIEIRINVPFDPGLSSLSRMTVDRFGSAVEVSSAESG